MSLNNKKSSDSGDWKLKLNDIVNTCQTEFKKTTKIGMKMLSASQSNVQLHQNYEKLGIWLVTQVNSGELDITDPQILELVERIKELKSQMESFEKDVQDIKNKD